MLTASSSAVLVVKNRTATRFDPTTTLQTAITNLVVPTTGADPGFSEGGSDLCPPTLSNCYCCLTSPFLTRKTESMVKIFAFVSL